MAGVKLPKVKTPAQMKAEMAVGRARTVLPKAEREANQAKFLEQSADSRRFYHGSKNPDITAFKTRKDLTDESNMTGHYADERDAVFLSPNPDFTNNFSVMGYTDEGQAPTTYPVYAQIKNPFDFDNPEHLQRVKDTYKDMYHNPESELYDPYLQSSERSIDLLKFNKAVDSLQGDENNWGRIENQKFQDVLKDIGYDSFYTRERGTKNLGVYDPDVIKSAIGNRGTYDLSEPDITKAHGGIVKMAEGGTPDREFIDRMREEFSVYNKPTYGNEIPGTPTIDQQRYELTMKGRQEAENRARTQRDSLTGVDPSGTLGIVDALKTVGKAVVAPIAYVGGNAFDWLQTGKVDPAKSKARGEKLENWMTPKTQEGGELLEEVSKVGPAITGSEMGFGMHPNLWASGIGLTTPKQTAAGLRLGSERVAPFAKDVGSMASELYMSGKIPGMVAPNMYATAPDGKPSKVLAPANESGFYSPTEAAALNLQRKSGAGQAFLNDIMKGENVRSDEIKTMGLDTFLKDKKNVTADEVRDYIAQNKIQLGESVYGYRKPPEAKPESPEDFLRFENLGEEIDSARNFEAETKAPKFESYALPGGENYREIVLTLPQNMSSYNTFTDALKKKYGEMPLGKMPLTEIENARLEKYYAGEDVKPYQSSHWDEPNALSHLRVSDRVTDGKKTLLVDEVQSDWHQAGREQGYDIKPTPEELNRISELEKKSASNNITMTERAEWAGLINKREGTIPDAPYKDDWYQLTLRRAIKEAIDGGYDRVALPTGSRVAERFDLSKQIDRIDYNKNDDGTYSMSAIKDGREVFAKEGLDEKELSGIVGKDVAKKIVGDEGGSAPKADRWESEDGDEPEFKSLSGLDLSVGGEGMKKYYDEIYPGYLKKFGKKYGANVGSTTVDVQGKPEPLHYMDITPAMRKEFSTGIPMKRGGKVQFAKSLDAMRHELTKAK